MQPGSGSTAEVDSDELVVIGRISGLFGVSGWVKVYSYTRNRQDILNYDPWYLRSQQGRRDEEGDGRSLCRAHWTPVRLEQGHKQGKGVVAKLQGISDRNQAAGWIDAEIAVGRAQLPALAEDEYYWNDLVGLQAVTKEGIVLGQVSGLLETGANDVLVIDETVHGKQRQRLIPFVQPTVVQQVDLANKRIVVDWDPEF